MKGLLEELNDRLKFLKSQPQTQINDGRISEIIMCIVRVQQMILDGLSAELREEKINKIIK